MLGVLGVLYIVSISFANSDYSDEMCPERTIIVIIFGLNYLVVK